MFTPAPESFSILPTPLTTLHDWLHDDVFRYSPEEELLYIEDEEFDERANLGKQSLDAAMGPAVLELPALEAAVAAGGEVVDYFSMVVFGCETECDLAIWSHEGVVAVVLLHQ